MCAWRRSSVFAASRRPRARPSWISEMRSTPFSASRTDIWPEPLPESADTSTSSAATGGLDWVSSPSDYVPAKKKKKKKDLLASLSCLAFGKGEAYHFQLLWSGLFTNVGLSSKSRARFAYLLLRSLSLGGLTSVCLFYQNLLAKFSPPAGVPYLCNVTWRCGHVIPMASIPRVHDESTSHTRAHTHS